MQNRSATTLHQWSSKAVKLSQTYSKCVELIADRTFCCPHTYCSLNRHFLASTPLNSTQIQPEVPQIVSNSIKCHEAYPDWIWDIIARLISFQTRFNLSQLAPTRHKWFSNALNLSRPPLRCHNMSHVTSNLPSLNSIDSNSSPMHFNYLQANLNCSGITKLYYKPFET